MALKRRKADGAGRKLALYGTIIALLTLMVAAGGFAFKVYASLDVKIDDKVGHSEFNLLCAQMTRIETQLESDLGRMEVKLDNVSDAVIILKEKHANGHRSR